MCTGNVSMRRFLLACAAPPLLLLTIGGCLPAFAVGDATVTSRPILTCDDGSRSFNVAANGSWQSFTLLAARQDFSGDCSIFVDPQANAYNGTSSFGWSSLSPVLQPMQQQPGILWKIENMQLGASAAHCDVTGNTLNVFVQNTFYQTGYICNVTTSLYMWASQGIKLYVYILSGSNSSEPYFTTAFLNVASPINICQQQLIANGSSSSSSATAATAADLYVDSEAYVFAPDARYSRVPPNNFTCSQDVNYTLTIAANGSTSPAALNLTVLAAPPSGSCWSLLLDGQRRSSGEVLSVAAGGRTTLVYTRDGGASANTSNCLSSLSSGFTVTATVVALVNTTNATATNLTTNAAAATPASSTVSGSSPAGTVFSVNSSTVVTSTMATSSATNLTTKTAAATPASSTVSGSSPAGTVLSANSSTVVISSTVATSIASKALQSSTAAVSASQSLSTTGLSWAASVSTNALNVILNSAGAAAGSSGSSSSSSPSGTTPVSFLAVAIGCSFAGAVVIAAAACAVAALLAASRNRHLRGRTRKADLYSTYDDKAGRSKATAPNAEGSHNLAYSVGSDADF